MPNTIAENLSRLVSAKSAIASAIVNMGGSVGVNDGFEAFPAAISAIPAYNFDITQEEWETIEAINNQTISGRLSLSGVAEIGSCMFQSCSNLNEVDFPECTTIGSNAFTYCYSLQSANFPVCKTIRASVFLSCSSLSAIYLLTSFVCTLLDSNAFLNTPMSLSSYLGYFGSIYVPSSLVTSYKTATNWTYYSDRIVGV